MIYTVEDSKATYSVKSTLKAAKTYANWLIDAKGIYVDIVQRMLVRKSDVPAMDDQPEGLFDDSYRYYRSYKRQADGKWK